MENDMPQQRKPSKSSLVEIYKQVHSKSFRKAIKRYLGSGRGQVFLIQEVVLKLTRGETLDFKYRDHKLTGDMQNYRECHVTPDLLLMYEIKGVEKELHLLKVGTHSELFG